MLLKHDILWSAYSNLKYMEEMADVNFQLFQSYNN